MHPAAPDIIAPRGLERGLVGTIAVSALLHAAAIGLMVVVPGSFLSAPPRIQSYTVDLVAPNVIGGTNLIPGGGPRKPAPAKVEPPQAVPAAESLPPAPAAAVLPEPRVAPAAPPPKVAEPGKAVEPPKPQEPPPVAAAPPKPVPPPPKPVEAKPAEPPRPAAAPAKVQPKPAVKADARKPPSSVEKPAPAKPVAQKPAPPPVPAKPASKPEAKPEPKSGSKAETKPKPELETKADAKSKPDAKPKPEAKAEPQKTDAKPSASKPADRSQDRDRAISEAVQKRAAQAGPGDAASKALDQRIAAAVQRRADQVEKGGSGAPGPGGPISAGPGTGVGGTPTDMQYVLYEGRMRERIRNAWAWTGADRTLTVVIQFSVAPDGQILNVRTLKSSGDPSYDASAERAVRAANPLEPVPEKYRDAFATVELTFRASDLES